MPDLEIKAMPILALPHSIEILIEGGVNASNATRLKSKIDAVLDRNTAYISILMRNVSFMNSSGFGYLMDLAMLVEKRGGSVVLVEVQPKVKVVLNNLGMGRFFRFEASQETTRAFLRGLAEKVATSPRLLALDGDQQGAVFPIVGTGIRIGADSKGTIQVKHPQVDPRHCEVYRTGDHCHVRDLGSRFGTFVGERKVNEETLKAGDVIRVGGLRLAYVPAGASVRATGP